MTEFRENTAAVIEYYREHGNRFAEVDGNLHIDDVTRKIPLDTARAAAPPRKQ